MVSSMDEVFGGGGAAESADEEVYDENFPTDS
jgi:hypothetical protein